MFVIPCVIVALLLLYLSFLYFGLVVRTWSRPCGLCHHIYTKAHIKGFGSFPFCMSMVAFFYAYVSLSCSRLCHVWHPRRVCGCVVTFDAHEALFGCNHLGMHLRMLGCFMHAFPFFHSVRWYACHACLCHPLAFYVSLHACLHVHAWVLLASVSSMLQHNEVMEIWSKPTFVPHGHHHLFAFLLVCLFSHMLACILVSLLAMSILLICFMPPSYALCIFSFHCLSAGFLSLSLHVHTWSDDVWS